MIREAIQQLVGGEDLDRPILQPLDDRLDPLAAQEPAGRADGSVPDSRLREREPA